MFAQIYHSSMKHAAPVRREMGARTIFNVLGPLSNPAGATMQLMGVYDRHLVEPLAQVLSNLGVVRGVAVNGSDGMDEVTLTGFTHVCEIRYGALTSYDITPEQFGFKRCKIEDLTGGSPEENARITLDILSGREKGPKRDVVVLNAAMALYLGIDNCTIADCVKTAQDLIDSGQAAAKLEEFRRLTNEIGQ
jgi:anthranilate phosphoribosyltransferase